MRFVLADGETFEIPDGLWAETGMVSFRPDSAAYEHGADEEYPEIAVTVVPIELIKPIHRSPGIDLDFGGFRLARLASVLQGIAKGDSIAPIRVWPKRDDPYEYAVYDGYHRFHASVAAGFAKIPVVIAKWGLYAVYDE